MNLTAKLLKKIIKEELESALKESPVPAAPSGQPAPSPKMSGTLEEPPEEDKIFTPCEDLQLQLDALSAELFDAYGTRDEKDIEESLRPYINEIKAKMRELKCEGTSSEIF